MAVERGDAGEVGDEGERLLVAPLGGGEVELPGEAEGGRAEAPPDGEAELAGRLEGAVAALADDGVHRVGVAEAVVAVGDAGRRGDAGEGVDRVFELEHLGVVAVVEHERAAQFRLEVAGEVERRVARERRPDVQAEAPPPVVVAQGEGEVEEVRHRGHPLGVAVEDPGAVRAQLVAEEEPELSEI
jgi:hypothetical protein